MVSRTAVGLLFMYLCLWGSAVADTSASVSPEEVLVTASRRETPLLDTPISMTVLSAQTLQSVAAHDFTDFSRLIPGLTAIDSGPGQKRYALRGLQSAGEPEVALYYDEIPVSGLPGPSLDTGDSQPDMQLWDIDRIEILRGPQGTLYGNGSMGGAIRVISHRPVLDKWEADTQLEGDVTAGGAPSWRLAGTLNLPLIPRKLALRVASYDRRDGGWIDDVYQPRLAVPQINQSNLNRQHTGGTRASLLWQPTDTWRAEAIGYYQDLSTGDSFETYPSFATAQDPYVSKAFVRTPWQDQSRMVNLISTLTLDVATLVATGSWQRRTVDLATDTTRFLLDAFGCTEMTWKQGCSGPPLIPAASFASESVTAWSSDFRLVSRAPGPWNWTLGTFVQQSGLERAGQVAKTDASGYVDFDPSGMARNRLFARDNSDEFDQYAVYGESSYELFRRLSATAGLRWFHSYRSDQQSILQQFFPGQPTGLEPFQSFSQSALFKKVELSYQLEPRGVLYTQAAQGFRAGGPNYPGGFSATAPPYSADSVWDYELGWKLSLTPAISWTADIFRIDWSNLQQLVPTALFSYITNSGSARSDGFETELSLNTTSGVSLDLGLAHANAHLIGIQPPSASQSLQLHEGEALANTPAWTGNASIGYSRSLGSSLAGRMRLDYTFQSSRASTVATSSPQYYLIASSSLFGLHASLETASLSIGFHVQNLLNRFAPLSAKSLDSNLVETVTAARPRTFGLTVSAHVL